MKKILLILALLSAPILVQAQYEAGRRSAVERTDVRERYTPGIGVNVGTMGKDLSVGVTLHNFINNKYLFNIYGSWDYRFWGYQSWKHTGAVGIGFGGIKSLVNLKKPVYFNKEKKKYFKSLGVGATLDIEQKFSEDSYIGGRYGATLWGQLNKNMLGLSLGIDHTRNIGLGMYGKVHYSFLFGK